MSNKQVKALAARIEAEIKAAQTSEQILKAIYRAKAFRKPLQYKHKNHFMFASVAILFGLLFILAPHLNISFIPSWRAYGNNWLLFASLASFFIGVGLIAYALHARKNIANIAALAYQKDAFLDNDLSFKAPLNSEEMRIRFSEFKRGNYSRVFKQVIGGNYKGEEHTFPFDYYHFHYVDKRTVVVKQGKSMRTKTVYDKYDRYGIMIPFGFFANMQIFNFKIDHALPHKITSGSIAFDKAFKVRCADELAATKFLKPVVVVAITDLFKAYTDLNIEIDATGLMCISFRDKDVVLGNQRYDLSNPAAFYDELAGNTKLRKLDRILRFAHQLMKYSDNNFKDVS